MKTYQNTRAVSPVVGVMLMLVVTIIIAAVVSAFAGGIAESKSKAPQAKITATFSISDGMQISHSGGDAIPYGDLSFIIKTGPGFGPNTESVSTQKINPEIIAGQSGNFVFITDRQSGTTAFKPGDTLTISADNCSCNRLQPTVSEPLLGPTNGDTHCSPFWDPVTNPLVYPSKGKCSALWAMCFRNTGNVGKTFVLQVNDKNGNLISKTDVKITS